MRDVRLEQLEQLLDEGTVLLASARRVVALVRQLRAEITPPKPVGPENRAQVWDAQDRYHVSFSGERHDGRRDNCFRCDDERVAGTRK